MVSGQIRSLPSQEEKSSGLKAIAQMYTPQWTAHFPQAIQSGLEAAAVYAIDIKEVTAKRKKFYTSVQEMKWQQME